MSDRVYLDHAATSPLRPEARAAMEPLLDSANASSLHREGRRARAIVDEARQSVARDLGVTAREIVFTSGGTEAIATAICGAGRAFGAQAARRIVTAATEHRATLAAVERLHREGWEITFVETDRDARVDPAALARALASPASLASFMLANNELGTINPIAELAAVARERGVLFHCDAVAGPGLVPIEPRRLGADLLSLAAHKFGGPLGAGVLYVREGVEVEPLFAGSQEAGRRAGTENVAGIAGLAAALAVATADWGKESQRLSELRDRVEAVRDQIDDLLVNGAGAPRLPSVSSLAFRGVDNEALLVRLDLAGIAVSTGSACAAGAGEPSHVIAALRLPAWVATGVIRVSLGWSTRGADVDRLSSTLPGAIAEMRETMRREVRQ